MKCTFLALILAFFFVLFSFSCLADSDCPSGHFCKYFECCSKEIEHICVDEKSQTHQIFIALWNTLEEAELTKSQNSPKSFVSCSLLVLCFMIPDLRHVAVPLLQCISSCLLAIIGWGKDMIKDIILRCMRQLFTILMEESLQLIHDQQEVQNRNLQMNIVNQILMSIHEDNNFRNDTLTQLQEDISRLQNGFNDMMEQMQRIDDERRNQLNTLESKMSDMLSSQDRFGENFESLQQTLNNMQENLHTLSQRSQHTSTIPTVVNINAGNTNNRRRTSNVINQSFDSDEDDSASDVDILDDSPMPSAR